MRKIYFNFVPCICNVFACLYPNLREKKANNYAHFVYMNFKSIKYHKALTHLNMSKA